MVKSFSYLKVCTYELEAFHLVRSRCFIANITRYFSLGEGGRCFTVIEFNLIQRTQYIFYMFIT